MPIKPLDPVIAKYVRSHQLTKKLAKQITLLESNFRHPSLHTEVLEPKSRKLYSFRVDQKYRAIFVVHRGEIEIVDINDHYQ